MSQQANIPEPASERAAWLVALSIGALGALALILVLTGVIGRVSSANTASAPPPLPGVAATPVAGDAAQVLATVDGANGSGSSRVDGSSASPGKGAHAGVGGNGARSGHRRIVGDPSTTQVHDNLLAYEDQTATHIDSSWMRGFYPIYATAQRTFGVNWLLIASIHKQESAFSTAQGIYHGLNFAGCCGGPMQFNVTNGGEGSASTWALVSDSYRYGKRPVSYDHMTVKHPSIYDDFDSIMAAAHLLSADGAGAALDLSAWNAAYDYYGHDATGVTYADQVLARAIGWSQHGFCVNCGLETSLVEAVHAAYGAPVAAALQTTATVASRKAAKRRR